MEIITNITKFAFVASFCITIFTEPRFVSFTSIVNGEVFEIEKIETEFASAHVGFRHFNFNSL